MNTLKGKVAFITGACGGLGSAISELFAKEGADLLLSDICMESLEALKAHIASFDCGNKVKIISCNVGKPDEVKATVDAAIEEFGKIDILVNLAGYSSTHSIADFKPEMWLDMVNVNLTGTYLTCHMIAPLMMAQKSGSIINMASVAGVTNRGVCVGYGATKAGVIGLTRTLANETAEHGVTVNAIAPGPIRSKIHDTMDQDIVNKLFSSIKLNRHGKPEDIANLALFLASDQGSWITGEVININGGCFMG